jgi:hypothetical protein
MSAFGDFERAVRTGVQDLAKSTLKDFVAQAQNDAQSFMKQAKEDHLRWTKQLAAKKLTKDEFADLVKGQEALATLNALTQAGLALAKLQRFRDALTKLVIDSAFKIFLK